MQNMQIYMQKNTQRTRKEHAEYAIKYEKYVRYADKYAKIRTKILTKIRKEIRSFPVQSVFLQEYAEYAK